MPARVIREALLDSDRYWQVGSDGARLLFLHLLLVADDLGNAEASTTFLRRRLVTAETKAETVDEYMRDLASQDLIRLYEADGKRYVHIPRFRQRLRHLKRANPRPPEGVEDSDVADTVGKKTTVESQANGGRSSAEVKRSEEKRSEEKKINYATPGPDGPPPPSESALNPVSEKRLPERARTVTVSSIAAEKPEDVIFGDGLDLLKEAGMDAKKARGLLAQVRKTAKDDELACEVVMAAVTHEPKLTDPGPWMLATVRQRLEKKRHARAFL